MVRKRNTYEVTQVGTSLMLVIFIVLSMVIFSLLSLSTALREYGYAKKNATRTTEFFTASNQAEMMMEKIAQSIHEFPVSDAKEKIGSMEGVTILEGDRDDMYAVEYHVPVSEKEELKIQIQVIGKEYWVTGWDQENIEVWEGEQTLPVLGNN